jgi:hypothetical protein
MSPFCFRPAFDRIGEVGFTGIVVGEIRETGPMMYKTGAGGLFGTNSNCQATHAARNYMDSILLVIPKSEQDNLVQSKLGSRSRQVCNNVLHKPMVL